jgi:hypothetical protein
MARWRVEGMIPFTRRALWRRVEELRSIDASFSFSVSPGSTRPSQPEYPLDLLSPAPEDLLSTPLPAPIPPLPPTRRTALPPMHAAVLEALDYMSSIAPAASGFLDLHAVVMQNIRLVEAAKGIKEWKQANTMEEDNTDNINGIITSRNIFGMAGSATRPGALAMLRAKEDDRLAAVATATIKENQAKDKIVKDTIAHVTAGF